MENEENVLSRRWYRHPVIAVLAGLAAAGAMTNVLLGYGPGFGFVVTYAIFAAPVSFIGGLLVGMITGRNGAKWAAVESALLVVSVAFYFSFTPKGFDLLSFLRLIPLGVPPTMVASIGGKLGECACRCRA